MEIDWDNHESSTRNRGTDGEGLIAHYDVIGKKEGQQIVHLGFHYYIEDDEPVDGRKLAHLSRAVGALIRKHLGAPPAQKICVKCNEDIEDPVLDSDEDERCENCADF